MQTRARQITFNDQYGVSTFPYGAALLEMGRAITDEHTEFWIGNDRGRPAPHLFDQQNPEHTPAFRVKVRREKYTEQPLEETLAYVNEKNRPKMELFWPGGLVRVYYPLTYQAREPYTGRVYDIYKANCGTLAAEYLNDAFGAGIQIDDFVEVTTRAMDHGTLYLDPFLASIGFLPTAQPGAVGDLLLIGGRYSIGHCAVIVENGKILHHMADRLSCIEPYKNLWIGATVAAYRHKEML